MYLEQTDYSLPGIGESINLTRAYNSASDSGGLFGAGWSSGYEEKITSYLPNDYYLRLSLADGKAVYFGRTNLSTPFVSATKDFYGQIIKNVDNSYTLTFKDGRIHQFSLTGRLLWQKDRNGNQTTLSYNGNGQLTGITDAFNRTLTVIPNSNGTIASISDSVSTIATYEYFPSTSFLKTVTYNDGSKYKFEYININGKTYLATVKDALDNVLETHAYDSSGRATTSEKHGEVEKYTLDYSHWSDTIPYTIVTDANQKVTKYYFNKSNGRNFITKTEGVCNCGGSGSEVTTFEFDFALNLTKKTDALNQQTLYTYDNNGNRLTMTDVLGTETYTYNNFGEILTRNDRMNGVTINIYDSNGNLLTAQDALNNTTTLTYKPNGLIETVKDALNHTTTLTYDSFGRLTQVTDANNKTTNYVYDARARLTSLTNAINQTTNFEYDLNNRLKKVIHPDTKFMTYTYDLAGRRTAMTDERDNTTNYGYDNAYRLTSMTDALTHTTTYGYDLMSNPTSQTDALGNITNYEYNDFNRLKKAIYPPATTNATRLEERIEYNTIGNVKKRIDTANRETLYDYDTAHRLIKTTDALNQFTQFEYNARSQMTKVKDALNQEYVFTYDALGRQLSQTKASATMSYEYDAVGNRTKRTDYTGRETDYVYDNLNRLTNINYVGQTSDNASYVYDNLSRLTSATNYAGTVSFNYDNRSRIEGVIDVFDQKVNYQYDANGNRTRLKFSANVSSVITPGSNNFVLDYVYDAANRLTQMTEDNRTFGFSYDNANRMTSKTLPNGVSSIYNYDGMSRLTQLKHQLSSNNVLSDNQYAYNGANQISQIAELAQTKALTYDNIDRLTNVALNSSSAENYSFDAVGNRTSSHLSSSYTHQPFNRLTATADTTYEYDDNGNITRKAIGEDILHNYTWDYENRLREATTRNGAVEYKYDALGRRVERTVAGEDAVQFTYDGLDTIFDLNTSDMSGTKYINGLGIDNKLSYQQGSDNYYFLQDHLGSTTALTNSNGAITEQTNYDSFGNATNQLSTRFQYTGREYDETTGLYYYRARWYDAQVGRFISEDPIGFAGGDVNLFGYVKNKPLKYKDPRGLDDADKPWYPDYPQTPSCSDDPDNPSPSMQVLCPLIEIDNNPRTAYNMGWQAQGRNFLRGDPQGGLDPYNGGFRHCVSACILAKRYGGVGSLGKFLLHDLPNEILYPKPDSPSDLAAEDIGSEYGFSGGCETCESSCLKSFPGNN